MKRLKSVTVIFLSVFIMFSTFIMATAENSKNENYNFLVENGFTADYLDGLHVSMINKMATQIKKTSYSDYIGNYEILISLGIPEEFLKDLPEPSLEKIRAYISDSNISKLDYKAQKATNNNDVLIKKLSVQLTDKNNSSIVGETVCIYWEWPVNKPLIRDEDFISAEWNEEFFCYDADSFYAEDYRRNSEGDNWTVSDSYSVLARSSLNSLGHWTKLYTTKKQVGGFMIFNLSPTHPISSDLDYDQSLYIDYSHETETVSTVAVCIVFILLVLSAFIIIIKIIKHKKK